MASKFGLRPGYAIDIKEEKPYGRNKGEKWDLTKQSDIDELDRLITRETPLLLAGGPPCEAFSQLLNISKEWCDQSERVQSRSR